MTSTFGQTYAVSTRVLQQIRRDRRFLMLSIVIPAMIIFMLKIFFDSADSPLFDPQKFVPPIGDFIVHFLTYILCAIVLVRERTQQTLTRMFVNGYRRINIVGGYLMAYSLLATVQSLIVIIELNLLFALNFSTTEMLAIYGVIWLLAVISIALGIFVSNFARNEGQVFPFIPLVIIPAVFFSGLIVPVENMPIWAQWLSWVTPVSYANEVIASLNGEGSGWFMLALLVYGIVVLILGTVTLREQE